MSEDKGQSCEFGENNRTGRVTISVGEVAELLGISKPTAYSLVNSSGFPVIQIGRRKIIPAEAFENWLEKSAESRAEISIEK